MFGHFVVQTINMCIVLIICLFNAEPKPKSHILNGYLLEFRRISLVFLWILVFLRRSIGFPADISGGYLVDIRWMGLWFLVPGHCVGRYGKKKHQI